MGKFLPLYHENNSPDNCSRNGFDDGDAVEMFNKGAIDAPIVVDEKALVSSSLFLYRALYPFLNITSEVLVLMITSNTYLQTFWFSA